MEGILGAFSKSNEESDLQFISYQEVMFKLSRFSGDTYTEVARALKLNKIHKKNTLWKMRPGGELAEDADGKYVSACLNHTIGNDSLAGATYFDGYENNDIDPERVGWDRSLFIMQLEVAFGFFSPAMLETSLFGSIPPDRYQQHRTSENTDRTVALVAPVLPFLNPMHPRFSAKLAAAVSVWLAMEDESLVVGKSPVNAMTGWLVQRYESLGLTHRRDNPKNGVCRGDVNKTAIDEAAKVANWKVDGGAPGTPD